jgi:hypothetical protein
MKGPIPVSCARMPKPFTFGGNEQRMNISRVRLAGDVAEPLPRVHLVRYHGVFAPASALRAAAPIELPIRA